MANKVLYLHKLSDEHSIRYEMDENRQVIEREKIGGRYKDDRRVTPTEAGFAIAGRRFLDKTDYNWKIPGELVSALENVIKETGMVYWAVGLAQAIQKMKDPKYVIVDYEAVRAAEETEKAA